MSYKECHKKTREVADTYPKAAVMWSGGKDSTVLLHITKPRTAYFVEAHEFPETIDYVQRMADEWKIDLKVLRQHGVLIKGVHYLYFDEITPDSLYNIVGKDYPNISKFVLYWFVMKVWPIEEQVKHKEVMTGMRWDEDEFRQFLDYEEKDKMVGCKALKRGIIELRLHPMLHWSEYEIHRYLDAHFIPKHPFYYQGYRSIGDKYTTDMSKKGERDGRNQSFGDCIQLSMIGYLTSLTT